MMPPTMLRSQLIIPGANETFPAAFEAGKATPKGDCAKLGTISSARVDVADRVLIVINAYTQFHWRGRKPLADYDVIRTAFAAIRIGFAGMRIGCPRIGAGLAGGDWSVISSIIDKERDGQQYTLVEHAG